MIPHEGFGRLRLAPFLPDADIADLEDWEFEDRLWVGEALGFSEWLRPVEEPEVLHSLAIDFARFPEDATAAVLSTIDLPLQAGMTLEEIRSALGEPVASSRLAPDQADYEFLTDGSEPYKVACTILDEGGLSYLVVMTQPL